jgi:hypothetical protein
VRAVDRVEDFLAPAVGAKPRQPKARKAAAATTDAPAPAEAERVAKRRKPAAPAAEAPEAQGAAKRSKADPQSTPQKDRGGKRFKAMAGPRPAKRQRAVDFF